MTAIVGKLRWQQPHECMAALAQLAAKAPADADRAAAANLAADLRRYADHIRVWLLAGPYTKDGAKRQALHDIPFPPEPDAPAAAVNWQGVRTGATPESSWYVPLDELLKGDQRVAYLRTWFRASAARMARLELASDDACKAWFNGALVVDRNVDRALAPAQDTPGVELRPGWNCLLLKVTQSSGNWSAAARVCGPGGERLADVVFLDDPEAADLAAADSVCSRSRRPLCRPAWIWHVPTRVPWRRFARSWRRWLRRTPPTSRPKPANGCAGLKPARTT